MHGSLLPKFVYWSQTGFRSFSGSTFTCRYLNLGEASTRQLSTTVSNGRLSLFKVSNSNAFRTQKVTPGGVTSKCYEKSLLVRHYSALPKEFAGKKTIESFRRRDGVPKSYELIYRSSFPNYLLCTQLFVFIATGAVITAGGIYLLGEQTEEEKRSKRTSQMKQLERMAQKERDSTAGKFLNEFKGDHGVRNAVAIPGLEDIVKTEDDPMAMLVIAVSFVLLAITLIRLQRFLPVRIYANSKDHCIAVMYGHFLPGRLTWHEFLAGTVRPAKGSKMDFYSSSLYQDGSGKRLILMEQFFRSSADYNRIMGFQEPQRDD